MKRQARTAGFRPIDLGARFLGRFRGRGGAGREPQCARQDQRVEAARRDDHGSAGHWDAYGLGAPDARGRRVRPGALDDAIGLAGVLEIARAFKAGPRPERTLVFAAWTAEERGLLGSEYYAVQPALSDGEERSPTSPSTCSSRNGRARDVVLIGKRPERARGHARRRRRRGRAGRSRPDARPERGLFYRADHFPFAKRGVPVLLLMALGGGVDLVEGGRERGDHWVSEYTANCYHQTCDEWSPDWDLSGAAQDVGLALRDRPGARLQPATGRAGRPGRSSGRSGRSQRRGTSLRIAPELTHIPSRETTGLSGRIGAGRSSR